jgi:hypothetical protein
MTGAWELHCRSPPFPRSANIGGIVDFVKDFVCSELASSVLVPL